MKKKIANFILIVFALCCIAGCGGSLSKWSADAQYGYYKMNEDEDYPNVSVSYWDDVDEFGEPYIATVINVNIDNMHSLDKYNASKDEDGAYHIIGNDYDYFVRFSGDGKIKVEMEKSESANFATGILKNLYKSAVGTYDVFEPYDSSNNEIIKKAVEEMYN